MSTLLFHHDFNKSEYSATPWALTGGGTLALTSAAKEFLTGGQAMKLTTAVTGAEEVHLYLPRPLNTGTIRFGARWAAMDENASNLGFYLGYRDGTNWTRAKVLHQFATNVWSYDAGGTGGADNVTLLTRDTSEATNVARWHITEVIADFRANKYVNVIIDDTEYSSIVSATNLRSTADVGVVPNMLDFAFETTNTGVASNVIIDEVWGYAE